MGDFLGTEGSGCTPPTGISYPNYNLETDVQAMISGMTNTSGGPFAFLGSSVDMTRIGLGGVVPRSPRSRRSTRRSAPSCTPREYAGAPIDRIGNAFADTWTPPSSVANV
jgi:hypothetical protein